MKRQSFNPYLPSWEYVPDGEPHVFGNRVYVYGSHDRFNGTDYCMNDYVCWSAPLDCLADWRYEGVIFPKNRDPRNPEGKHNLYAPDVVCGRDGKYYLFYCLEPFPEMSVAVCDTPAGEYEFYGFVRYADGRLLGSEGDACQFDPSLLIDDDGKIYLYSGNAYREKGKPNDHYSQVMRLKPDMLTLETEPKRLLPGVDTSEGTGFEGHEFFEASSIRKINGKYYLLYSSVLSHELCWAISDSPDGGFRYGGTVISNGDIGLHGRTQNRALNAIGNNHGGLVRINGQWYVFYHRHTNRTFFSRQGCAEKIEFDGDDILQAEITSCGLNDGALFCKGEYPASIACDLINHTGRNGESVDLMATAKRMTRQFACSYADAQFPYFTQDEEDGEEGTQYIANVRNGAEAGYKYFDFGGDVAVNVTVRGTARGKLALSVVSRGERLAEIAVQPSAEWKTFGGAHLRLQGRSALYFTFEGEGILEMLSFRLS